MNHQKKKGKKNTFYKLYYSRNKPNADLALLRKKSKISEEDTLRK